MGKKVLLLGFGMQGKAALFDLINCNIVSHILVVDNQPDLQNQLLQYPVERVSGKSLDVNDKSNMFSLMSEIDLVVEALPGPFALPMGQLAAECGVNLVSSMYYHDPGETDNAKIQLTKNSLNKIDKQAKAKNIIILSEFGLDPGLDIILGVKAKNEMEILEELYMYGAGIPASNARTNPLKYKFSWNIMGVIDAYHRPASFITKGQSVEIEASRIFESDNCHLINVKEIGSPLESFVNGNSVYFAELLGIRDSIQEMKRYTCRLPGHCTFWNTMVKCGFLNENPIFVKNVPISPVQFTATLLSSQKQFFYSDDEQDMTFLRIDTRGIHNGQKTQLIYDLIDFRDLLTGYTSMQRTVGFTMSLGAQLILDGRINKKGLLTPIDIPYEMVISHLEKHNIQIIRRESPWK